MKKILIIIGVIAVIGVVIALFCGGGGEKLENVEDLKGVYEGEAVVHMDDKLKEMVTGMAAKSNVKLPEGPIACKIGVNVNEGEELTMELVDFKLPVEGVTLEPSICTAEKMENGFAVKGEGSVKYGVFGIKYTHEGTVEGRTLKAELKMSVPLSGELRVEFEGNRK